VSLDRSGDSRAFGRLAHVQCTHHTLEKGKADHTGNAHYTSLITIYYLVLQRSLVRDTTTQQHHTTALVCLSASLDKARLDKSVSIYQGLLCDTIRQDTHFWQDTTKLLRFLIRCASMQVRYCLHSSFSWMDEPSGPTGGLENCWRGHYSRVDQQNNKANI